MPAFLENGMGPCLRRDDLLKKQTLHQHIEEHYLEFFNVYLRTETLKKPQTPQMSEKRRYFLHLKGTKSS